MKNGVYEDRFLADSEVVGGSGERGSDGLLGRGTTSHLVPSCPLSGCCISLTRQHPTPAAAERVISVDGVWS